MGIPGAFTVNAIRMPPRLQVALAAAVVSLREARPAPAA
jgi:hypothetical protein